MDSSTVKQAVVKQVLTESSVANARILIEKIQENCFQNCVPKPGASLSSGEQSCMTSCIEKYMNAWNHVNSTYITRLQQNGQGLGN